MCCWRQFLTCLAPIFHLFGTMAMEPQAQDPSDYDNSTQIPDEVYEGMSETAVADFLREQAIPKKYCEIFEGMLVEALPSLD